MTPAATARRKPATVQTIAQIWRSGMPTASAAWWSSATARSARPIQGRLEEHGQHGDEDPGHHRRQNRSNWLR
jgi:hypothetical protein